jgi:hypothetical protein
VNRFLRVALASALAICVSHSASAQFTITSPSVERGQFAAEWNGTVYSDGNLKQGHEFAADYGVTNFWAPGLSVAFERDDDHAFRATTLEWSNLFAFGTFGGFDLGLEANLNVPLISGGAYGITAGPAVAFGFGPILATVNATFGREFGEHREPGVEFGYGVQTLYLTSFGLDFGFEAYGTVEDMGDAPPLAEQEHWIGPAAKYLVPLDGAGLPGEVSLSAGILFGLTDATPRRAYNFGIAYDLDF